MCVGFRCLVGSGFSLVGNTAAVAYGALGTPVSALVGVTVMNLFKLSSKIGQQLPGVSLILPFWLIWAFAGFRGVLAIWAAALIAGGFFAVPQFLISNFHGPWLVDIVSAVVSMVALTLFLKIWHPKQLWLATERPGKNNAIDAPEIEARMAQVESAGESLRPIAGDTIKAWVPWIIHTVFLFLCAFPQFH